MRRPEWSRGNQGMTGLQQAADTEHRSGFNGFIKPKGRQDGGDTAGQHGLAGTGGTDHQ